MVNWSVKRAKGMRQGTYLRRASRWVRPEHLEVERMVVLAMLAARKITAEQAAALLDILER